jgi:hypothetical protein
MGNCCGGTTLEDEKKEGTKYDTELGAGAVENMPRGCTDCFCLLLYWVHFAVFIAVVLVGLADGDPKKLYAPRDFMGAYCGVEKNWNDGPVTTNARSLTYFMNVTKTVDPIAKAVLCSDIVEKLLVERWDQQTTDGRDKLLTYRCSCCKMACQSCTGNYPTDFWSDPSSLAGSIDGKITELTSGGDGLYDSANSANGDMVTEAWSEFTSYFVTSCASSCDAPQAKAKTRTYTYSPVPDDPLIVAWTEVIASIAQPGYEQLASVVKDKFTFPALSEDDCPYNAFYCVQFPGVTGTDVLEDGCPDDLPCFCQPKMTDAAMASIGDAGGQALESVADTELAGAASETLGSWLGAVQETVPAILIASICGFVIGFIFMIILRFIIGIIVWLSILLLFVILIFAGALSMVRSSQCKGAGLFDSGAASTRSASASAEMAAAGLATDQNPFASEVMTGKGFDYRGIQTKTRSGKSCQNWDCRFSGVNGSSTCTNLNLAYNSTNYPEADLRENYCRNPTGPNSSDPDSEAFTIWCYTTDTTQRWEVCIPYGVLQPVCADGYEVSDATAREVLVWIAYILWAMAGIWFLMVWCLYSRIQLAIAVNKVAAMFLSNTNAVIFVPIVLAIIGLIWCLVWASLAMFLISQVPEEAGMFSDGPYVPTTGLATYEEAYGYWKVDADGNYETDQFNQRVWQTGACNAEWPEGSVWKDNLNCVGPDFKCWMCAPPRYIFDARFAYTFFTFLWSNAFLQALLQLLVAVAVGIWFFTPNDSKIGATGGCKTVLTSLKISLRYHQGSLLFGAFLIAVVQFIRYFMMYLEKQAQAQKNKVMEYLAKCVQCVTWCLEKCLKFLNKNAYIQIALAGYNFCQGAKKAMGLILRNFVRFGVIASIGWITQMIGYSVICAATTILGYFILRGMNPDVNPIPPVFLILIIGYIIGRLFSMVFTMAVDTSLQCYIICEEKGISDDSFIPGPMHALTDK